MGNIFNEGPLHQISKKIISFTYKTSTHALHLVLPSAKPKEYIWRIVYDPLNNFNGLKIKDPAHPIKNQAAHPIQEAYLRKIDIVSPQPTSLHQIIRTLHEQSRRIEDPSISETPPSNLLKKETRIVTLSNHWLQQQERNRRQHPHCWYLRQRLLTRALSQEK